MNQALVHQMMENALKEEVFPGGVLLVSHHSRILFFRAYGMANIFTGRQVCRSTFFDLASLTKPLATTLSLIRLSDAHKLDVDVPVSQVLPVFGGQGRPDVQIAHLLSHTSGLPAYQPYYKVVTGADSVSRKKDLRHRLTQEALIAKPGEKTVYSDLGFMLLDWIIERLSGVTLDRFVAKEIYAPLGITDLMFLAENKPPALKEMAATEQCPWRNRLIEGQVHDENAYASGGVQGHAGLFGTAESVHRLLVELMNAWHGGGWGIFSTERVRHFLSPYLRSGRTLGFDMPSEENSSSGRYFSDKTVGHLGFTGVSFWMDLMRQVIVILLTNRVHPSRENIKIRRFRPRLHDRVMKEVCFSQGGDR